MDKEYDPYDGFSNWSDVMDAFEEKEPEPDRVYLAWYGGV
jgi:hypothetical protein